MINFMKGLYNRRNRLELKKCKDINSNDYFEKTRFSSKASFLKATVTRRIIFLFIGTTVWALCVIPSFLLYKAQVTSSNKPFEFGIDMYNKNRIDINMKIVELDLFTRKGSVFTQFKPIGTFAYKNSSLTEDVTLNFGFENKNSFIMTLPLIMGSALLYPFDRYYSLIPINLVLTKNSEQIPRKILITGLSESYETNFNVNNVKKQDTNNNLELILSAKRTKLTITISMFMLILMWALSISITIIAYGYLFKNCSEVDIGILILGITMLFALPAMRSSQPGIPQNGCLIDLLGYFWNMITTASSSVAITYIWALRWKK